MNENRRNTSNDLLITNRAADSITIQNNTKLASSTYLVADKCKRKISVSSNSMGCMCNCANDLRHSQSNSKLFNREMTPIVSSTETFDNHPQSAVTFIANNDDSDSLCSLNTKVKNKLNNKQKEVVNSPSFKSSIQSLDLIMEKHFGDVIKKINETIEKNKMHSIERDQRQIVENEWSDFALILDRLLFLSFTILTIGSTVLIFFMSPHLFTAW